MPMTEQIGRIIDLVIKATDEGGAQWKCVDLDDFTFELPLDDFTVEISSRAMNFDRDDYLLKVRDESGQVVDSVNVNSGADLVKLESLYEKARRIAMSVDEKLTRLTKQLEQKLLKK
jgi:hypothetical protein